VTNATTGFQDITDHHTVTNTLSGSAFYTHVIDTCQQIYDVLTDHCGPLATDALIVQNNDGRNLKDANHAIFTKDGINIVRSIQFISPLQTNIQNLIAYVGSRVDSRSHDGTTTAMLLFSGLVKYYFALCLQTVEKGDLLDHHRLRRDLSDTLDHMKEHLEQAVITVDQFAKDFAMERHLAVRHIAHYQAMLSSKGDHELSDAIVEVVETLPVELYGLFTVQQSKLETNRRFTVLHDDYDVMINAQIGLDLMNHRLGTEYLSEACDLVVSEDDLVRGNPALEIIEMFVGQARDGLLTRDLVIITKSIDATLLGIISNYNRVNDAKIVVFTYSTVTPYSSRVLMLSAVMAMASVYPMQEHIIDSTRPFMIRDAKVHFRNRRLYLSNLYQKDGSLYHPSFTDPQRFLPYTTMVRDIREHLESVISGRSRIETNNDKAMYEDYVEIYRRMISSDVRNLQISGMRHDTLAGRDVLQDAFGAVLSSLENGFVLDGYLKLFLALNQTEGDTPAAFAQVIRKILETVHKRDAETMTTMKDASPAFLHQGSLGAWDGLDSQTRVKTLEIPLTSTRGWLSAPREDTVFAHHLQGVLEAAESGIDLKYYNYPVDGEPEFFMSGRPVIQPADGYRELFTRLEDLLPKLIATNRAIIPGTMNSGIGK
jgi:hypothetical protein